MRTVLGFEKKMVNGQQVDDISKPLFAKNGGLSLLNSTQGIETSSFGYQRAITTLTYIKTLITEQIFYKVNPLDYAPVVVGEGSFAQAILTNITFSTSGDFFAGLINQGNNNDQLAKANVGISSITTPVFNWAKSIDYTIFEIEQALQANNWDLIKSKHDARKENWDLGIQQMFFLGMPSDPVNAPGLLNNTNVNINSAIITQLLNTMTFAQFTAVVADLLEAYRSNSNRTAYPTHFIIPEDDYNGMMVPYTATATGFPLISIMEYLKKAFAGVGLPNLKIMPSAYAMPAYNASASGLDQHTYTLLNYDVRSVRMDIPVMITATQPNTINNFQFQDAAYGQFTPVVVIKPLEMLYFQNNF
jgi:hypothetical protein